MKRYESIILDCVDHEVIAVCEHDFRSNAIIEVEGYFEESENTIEDMQRWVGIVRDIENNRVVYIEDSARITWPE